VKATSVAIEQQYARVFDQRGTGKQNLTKARHQVNRDKTRRMLLNSSSGRRRVTKRLWAHALFMGLLIAQVRLKIGSNPE
jgi:hypothetical protein